jgi:TRAP-type mannitol/chloroaromatic compound transport system permease small subunit
MAPLLAFSRAVDRVSAAFGRVADWMVLAACVVSASNAFLRYGISAGSNAWLEAQWYLFAGMVMLGASYTLQRNEHVRVDLVYGNLGWLARIWVDILGIGLFLLPAMLLLAWMTWPFFVESWVRGETSAAPGGLVRWPAKLVMPVGFALVAAQGASELIKRVALLRPKWRSQLLLGGRPVVADYARPEQ